MPPERSVALVGFMGAGKSTVARILAEDWGWEARDLDEEIRRRTGRSPAVWIQEEGEDAFRRQEGETLGAVLAETAGFATILACGGGTFCQEDCRELLLDRYLCVWLDLPLATALDRAAGGERPLLEVGPEVAERLYLQRSSDYAQAHLRIESSGGPQETARRLEEALVGSAAGEGPE